MVEKLPFGGSFLCRVTNGAYSVDLIPYGAAVQALRVPDCHGNLVDVVLGYDTPEEYATQDACLGAIIGRYANRISNAAFPLNGRIVTLFANEGKNTLHGGENGFHQRLWDMSFAPDSCAVTCKLHSPDGDQGFPGNLDIEVRYILQNAALTIHYAARCDQDTALNLTNHTYFNLAGHSAGTIRDHLISLAASRYTPADSGNIPTGVLRDVSDTPWDLRQPTPLGSRLAAPELQASRGFDQNFVLDGAVPAATVFCPATGIQMAMETDREGVQLYTSGWLTQRSGKGGAVYGPGQGLCLETQHFPDAVNKPNFPSPFLKAGELFESVTTFRFSTQR